MLPGLSTLVPGLSNLVPSPAVPFGKASLGGFAHESESICIDRNQDLLPFDCANTLICPRPGVLRLRLPGKRTEGQTRTTQGNESHCSARRGLFTRCQALGGRYWTAAPKCRSKCARATDNPALGGGFRQVAAHVSGRQAGACPFLWAKRKETPCLPC